MISPDIVDRAVEAISRRADAYEYFFDQLQSGDWVAPLAERGFFAHPPAPIASGDYVRFPSWPESRYLARVASDAPEEVARVITLLPQTDNTRVHQDLIEAVTAMPGDVAVKLVPTVAGWLDGAYRLLIPEKVGDLVVKLIKDGKAKAGATLARRLLRIKADERTLTEGFSLRDLHGDFDDWTYRQTVEQVAPTLFAAAPRMGLELFADLLGDAIALADPEPTAPSDGSYSWRSAIESSGQNSDLDVRAPLVDALRDGCLNIVTEDPAQADWVLDDLEGRPWRVFHRIALFLAGELCGVRPELATARVMSVETSGSDLDLHHEYWLLVRQVFSTLPAEAKDRLLAYIDAGPSIRQGSSLSKESEENQQSYAEYWRLTRLSLIGREALPPGWQARYDEVVSRRGEPEHPEFLTYHSGVMTGPNSPKSSAELASMSDQDLMQFLRDWRPSGEWMGDSQEGLGRMLAAAVEEQPARFAAQAGRLRNLDPTYGRSVLSGLRTAATNGRAFDWPPVLEFCEWILGQRRDGEDEEDSAHLERDPGWSWARREIPHLLSAGFNTGDATLPWELREDAWRLLSVLLTDPDPSPEHESRYGGSNMDPVTLGLNSTRGQAMNAVVHYALWVRRHLEADEATRALVSEGFNQMPEVAAALEAHLDPNHDPSVAVRSVYGRWLPQLALLDTSWVTAHLEQIFPRSEEERELRAAAWESYLLYGGGVYDGVTALLGDEYRQAVLALGQPATRQDRRRAGDPERFLAEHLMIMYWRGQLALAEPEGLLARFFELALPDLRGHAMSFVGITLHNSGEVPQDFLERLERLWEWRAEVAQANPSSFREEQSAFGWWFGSRKFDPSWALPQLLAALQSGPVEVNHLVGEYLREIAPAFPLEVIAVLRRVIETDDGWQLLSIKNDALSVIEAVLGGSDADARAAAFDLIHLAGAKGHREFRSLLPEQS